MARARSRIRKKRSAKKRQGWFSRIHGKTLLYAGILLSLLLFSVGILTYVVFFRVVVAAELPGEQAPVPFEEPQHPVAVEPHAPPDQPDRPKCAIIIDDMGYHREIGRQLIALPLDISFSFLPHAPHTAELEELAHRAGKTIMLHLPLQPKSSAWDPGPGALLLEEQERQQSLFQENLLMVPRALGVNNHMGSLYTENRHMMASLLDLIRSEKLFFIDSHTTPNSVAFLVAREKGVKAAKRQLFLDNVEDVQAICSQMKELADIALRHGQAIGIAHPHKETLEALRSCTETISAVDLVGAEKLVY